MMQSIRKAFRLAALGAAALVLAAPAAYAQAVKLRVSTIRVTSGHCVRSRSNCATMAEWP